MDSGFYWYAFKRLALVIALIVGFCMLPGPRSFISEHLAYLWLQESVDSVSYGIHLSLIHFCWLFGFETPSLQYPKYVEPQLTSVVLVASIACQLGMLCGLIVLWRLGLHAYYLRLAALDEIAEFGDGLPDPEDPSEMEIAPIGSPSPTNESNGKKAKRIDLKQARIELSQVDGVDVTRTERIG